MILKVLFILAAIAGVALIFVVSWFWRLLLIPMVLLLTWDFLRDLFRKKDVRDKSEKSKRELIFDKSKSKSIKNKNSHPE